MKKISIRLFLILILTITSVFFLIVFIGLVDDVSKTYNYIDYSSSFRKAYLKWTKAQQAQKDFLIHYENDPVFFQTEQSKFLKRQEIILSDAKLTMDSLKALELTEKLELGDDIQLYTENIEQIKDVFFQISHNLFLRGSKKTGIIGNCFSFYQTAISSTNDPQILRYLNSMNNNFLAYLNSPNFDSYEEYLDYFTYLNSYVRQQQIVRDTGVIDTTQFIPVSNNISSEFISSVNDYKQSFSKLVNIDRKLFLNDQANLMMQWSDINNSFEDAFITSVNYIVQDVTSKRVETKKFILYLAVSFFLFFMLINIFLPRILFRRIQELKEFIEPLKTGRIPDFVFEPKYFSELVQMSDTIGLVVKSLKDASVFASEIGNGNFKYNYSPVSDQDELGNALILLRDNLKNAQIEDVKRKEEDKIREWVNTGIAKFSDVLRQSTKDISELASLIIKDLVNYLEANQGGMFIINDEHKDKIIELIASYAYSKERKKRKEFLMGEGLIGTCAVEKATIYMTEIPEDYISITSGLGGANPRSLLIVPLKFEENVLGVIELASFNKLEKHQIVFVEKIAESIASTISIAKINQRTVKLLDSAKIEAEQRSLKEEELRQNLEELQATQERATQRESELNNLLSAINKAAFIIELDVDGNIVSVPERLNKTFEMESNDIIGHHISEFDYNEESRLADLNLWQDLIEGKETQHQLKFVKTNKIFWFKLYIVPFTDKTGEVIKFISIIIEITEQIEMQEELLTQTNELQIKEQEILKKINELQSVSDLALKEKKAAQELSQKIHASEDVLKKSLERNNLQLKKNEELVKRAEYQAEQFKFLFEHSSDSIQVIKNGNFIDCNNATLELFEFESKDEFIGISPSFVSPELQPDGQNSMKKVAEMINIAIEKGFNSFEWVHKKSNGTEFPANVTLVSFTQKDELFLYALIQDLTLRNQLISKDKQYKAEAEKNKHKAREFRTKLEKLDVLLEQKDAEIYILKKQIQELKNMNN
ncbi:MAG: PAS domain S-box protein [Bacteroidales bacterium]|nr:PAS domain S-box protein [Bacteroidales bacterium]